jgi:adenylate cyclase
MLYPAEFILAVFFSFFASVIFKYLKEDKNKKVLNKALSEYVSKEISEEILS